MAGLEEKEKWESEIYQIEENDPVQGGANGITNKPTKQLANRTLHLRKLMIQAGQKAKPLTITATSQNIADENGHTHAIDHASTSRKGVVQLTNDTGLDSESLALTAKAGKKLSQEIAQNRINTTNLANQKVDKTAISDSVSSTSQTTVASSRAVKTAYDKGVEGLNKANEVDRNALKNRGFQRLNGNLLITPDSWTDNSWNEWASLRLATKRGYWQFEVNPHSDDANDRRLNFVYREGGDNFYLHFRSIGTGEFVAYESWVIQQIANIPHASTTRRGLAQLTNDTWLDSESLAFSAKGAKILAQQIAQNRINTTNLANQKVDKTAISDSVSSTSQTTVGSSRAVKTAYDKGVEGLNKANEAKTAADNANNNANGRVSKSGDVMTGQLHIKIPNSDYGAVHLFNRANRKLVIEANPDSEADSIGNFIYREANDSNPQATVKIPKKSGILAVREEVERAYNRGTEALNRANQAHFPDQAYVRTTVHDNGYGGIDIVRQGSAGSWASRIEALPDKRWKFWVQNSHEILLPAKGGTVLLDNDFSYQKIGNFEIYRYPDGAMTQIYSFTINDLVDWSRREFNWAVAFKGTPHIFTQITTSVTGSHDCGVNVLTSSNNAKVYYHFYENGSVNQGQCRVQFLAMGRWK